MKTQKVMLTLLRIGSIFYSITVLMILYSIANGDQVFRFYHLLGIFLYTLPQIYYSWFYDFNN